MQNSSSTNQAMEQNVNALIVVVDDDQFMRVYLRDLLNTAGFRVVTATDGITALNIFTSQQPDLMLLDFNMPEMDGFQTCREIRLYPNGKLTPILMVTSVDDEESIQQAFEAGATDFITKPVKPGILIHRIRHILRSTRSTIRLAKDKVRLDIMQRIARLSDWEWNPTNDEFCISGNILRLLGISDGSTINSFEGFLSIFPYHDRGRVVSTLKAAFHCKSTCLFEFQIPGHDLSSSMFRLHGQVISETPETTGIMVGTIQDVTEIRLAEDRTLMLKQAIECLPIGITLVDRNGKIIYVNPAEAEIHGYSAEELIGAEARKMADHRLRKPFLPEQLESFGTWSRESVNIRKNGQEFPVQLTSVVVKNSDGENLGMVTTCEDITTRKNAEKKIHHLAYFDSLTGLPNRRMFQDRLNHALALAHRENRRVCLLFLDLDKFKDVNDTQGHRFGDSLLQAVATRLHGNMRESDTLARVGGDEFVIILTSVCDQENAATAAGRILSLFAEPFAIEGRLTYSSASIGIAMYPDDGLDNETLLKCADNAMYHAKNEGRSHYRFYSAEIHQKMMRRVAIENGLRYGLERREFFLHYQPQWDLETAGITGVEVLLRWQSQDFGLMPPAEFITLTEDSGLICELGEWILHTACMQTIQWALTGHKPLKVAINISGQQLRQPGFLKMVEKIIRGTGIDPEVIELEFTESVLMDHADRNIQILRNLKKMGMQLSVDDFGTGYSSLSYLKNFPIDKIKIDRSFIKDVTESTDNLMIVKAIISLAESLNLKVIAEGVENREQLDILKKLGCHEVQGFYLAEPMCLENLTEMLGCRHAKILNNCLSNEQVC
ncbi:MAG TPA: EAL domain-containing protein [Geobacteraceae bacterium]|nr:EAL domain-containing protein [Geobacteraceae bacterium]